MKIAGFDYPALCLGGAAQACFCPSKIYFFFNRRESPYPQE